MGIQDSADVAESAWVDPTADVWHLAQVRERAVLEAGVVVGRGAYIGPGVRVGRNSKIQNYALVYEPARLGEGVFIGPAATLTNDLHPRAVTPGGERKASTDWQPVGVVVHQGASIGAHAVCVAPIVIGQWAMVAAGAVVTRDVPAFALVTGVPARQVGWVGRTGVRLAWHAESNLWICPHTGAQYELQGSGQLTEVGVS